MSIAEAVSVAERRRRLIVALGSARPSHAWDQTAQSVRIPGCRRCPDNSPFRNDRASHPYVIEEEL